MKNLTQREILSEGFWNRFKKVAGGAINAVKKTAEYTVPELYKPISNTKTAIKDILGMDIDKVKRRIGSQKGITSYKGKSYSVDLTKGITPSNSTNGTFSAVGYALDQSGKKISNTPVNLLINKNAQIIKVY